MEDPLGSNFKRVRLTGTRFNGGRLPVDSLIELQKYQDVLRIAAEAEWNRDHPGQDSPADLKDSVSLAIERIDEGSADVLLVFEQVQEYQQYQAEARAVTDSIVKAAYSGATIPKLEGLSDSEEYSFRTTVSQIGSTLEPGQTMELYLSDPSAPPITISSESRVKASENLLAGVDFLLAPEVIATPNDSSRVDVSLIGKITALDAERATYNFVQSDGTEIKGRYGNCPHLVEDLRSVLNTTSDGPLTRVSGELRTYTTDAPRLWTTTGVEQLQYDDTESGRRLTELASLNSDWDGAGAPPISSVALDAAQTILRAIEAARFPRPGIFPTPDGGVLIEWGNSESVESVEILEDASFETFRLPAGKSQGEHGSGINIDEAIDFVKRVKA
ncbi:hypothetical protein ACH0AG_11080 [Micrococcus luteus]|uniref:Uncharacterized protein n=1 Tax=Micrococcus luteus TaxID=1270 RepID=A0AAP3AH45_MICLU|nr:hypothetical protein [Micrococcus luteus]